MALLACLPSFAQLDQVVNEYYGSLSTGEEVYRIYVQLDDPTDFVSMVYGSGNNSMYIRSDIGGLVNSSLGTITGDILQLGLCAFVTDACLDSYVTIGYAGQNGGQGVYMDGVTPILCGSSVATLSTLPNENIFYDAFVPEIGSDLTVTDGAWLAANTPGCNDQGYPFGPYNRVLIAQIALPLGGSLEYALNIQIFNEGIGSDAVNYVWFDDTENPNQELGLDKGLLYPYGNCTDETACNYNEFPGEPDIPGICNYNCIGCTDTTACNYDPNAMTDDGSCSNITGCTDQNADNYESTAGCDDGSCIFMGCTDTTACNFDPEANIDDGSCALPDGCDEEGAINYDPTAICNDGSCEYDMVTSLSIEQHAVHDGISEDGTDLTGLTTWRMYVNFPSDDFMLSSVYGVNPELLNISSSTSFWQSPVGGNSAESIFPALFPFAPSLEFDSYVTIGKENADSPGTPIVTIGDWSTDFGNGDDIVMDDIVGGAWYVLNGDPENVINAYPDENLKILVGQFTTDGEIDACINVQIFHNGDGSAAFFEHICATSGPLQGCIDSAYCNYNPSAEVDDGSCTDVCPGCMDTLADNFDSNATQDDGDCLYLGCTDTTAANYDSGANLDDGLCEFLGCTDPLAFNFDPQANADDESCDYDCDGNIVFLDMMDSFGLGWNGAPWTLNDSDGELVSSGSMVTAPVNDGSFAQDVFCLEDGCYTFEVGGGLSISETSWVITFDGNEISGNSSEIVPLDFNGACIVGCQDGGACNYDITATINYGCEYSCVGCTDSGACNYEADNTLDDGTCLFQAVIEGYVYHDTDQNGQYLPMELADPGLANWSVELVELGVTAFTTSDGFYQFFNVPAGAYTLQMTNIDSGWVNSSPMTITTSAVQCLVTNQNFGFFPIGTTPFYAVNPGAIFMNSIHCDFGVLPALWLHNIGPVGLSGQITITYDPILGGEVVDDPLSGVDPDVLNPGEATWYLDGNPEPGMINQYQIHIPGPGADLIGQFFDININLSLTDEDGNEFYNEDWLLQLEVVCSYDPNDKYTEFPGYTDNHFIIKDDQMEYRIRFQNEGNWPAQNIIVRDTLDFEHLDLSTFSPAFGSHSFLTCLHDDGAVEFHFEDINLPDMESDEIGSQGFVVFHVTPRNNVQPGDVINNTAHIFFDNNPAVVTNTTWHTIYECGEEAAFDLTSPLCVEEAIVAIGTHEYVDDYLWTYDGDEISTDMDWSEIATNDGALEITLTASNILCDPITLSQYLNVNPLPDAFIILDGNTMTASDGQSWQWYFNGELIPDATEQVYTAEVGGVYAVEVTNEWDCSLISDDEVVTVTSIEENEAAAMAVYPNPTTGLTAVRWNWNSDSYDLKIFNAQGQIVRDIRNISSSTYNVDLNGLATGFYTFRSSQNHIVYEVKLIVQ